MRWIVLFLPLLLMAGEFTKVLEGVQKGRLLQAKDFQAKAMRALYLAQKAQNLPSLDATLDAAKLRETPTMYLHLPRQPVVGLPMGKKTHIEGALMLRYPLFSGFAITSMIQKSRLEYLKAKLTKKDLQRNLYLEAARLYAALYAANEEVSALQKAYAALRLSYKKAQGLYDQGLAPLSDVYNIEAKMYAIKAQLASAQARQKSVANTLAYLSGYKPKATQLPHITLPQTSTLLQRADIAALSKELAIGKSQIKLAKSTLWPKIGIEASLKRFGDSIALDGDGYRNADESYVGIGVRYNLFHGMGDMHKIEAAKAAYLAKRSYFNDYVQRAKTDLANAKIKLGALQEKLAWAKKQLRAAREYARLVQGRYDNQLASADELSRAIAQEAEAKAKLAAVRSEIFAQKCTVALMMGLQSFQRAVR